MKKFVGTVIFSCILLLTGESETIKGRYLADQSQLIIFDANLGQNYGFDYTPQGDTLLLGMNGSTVTLEKQK